MKSLNQGGTGRLCRSWCPHKATCQSLSWCITAEWLCTLRTRQHKDIWRRTCQPYSQQKCSGFQYTICSL